MKETKIIAYKGFDENLCCRGFQYEVGKEYELDGEIECYGNGFHACTNPFDVLEYYEENVTNRFCIVEQSGIIKSDGRDSTQASSKIKILAEIERDSLFKDGIDWIKEKTNPYTIIKTAAEKGNVERGSSVQIASSSNYAHIVSSGECVKIASSGEYAHIGSIGYYDQISSSGDESQIGSSGEYAKIVTNGYCDKIGSSGVNVNISSCGLNAQIVSIGDYAQIGSSGISAKIASSGDFAEIASSGNAAKIFSSGYSAKIGSSGDYAMIESSGQDSVICCAGNQSMVRAKKGSWVTLSEWKYSKEKGRDILVCVKTEFVDGERIEEDTWYKLVDGEFTEQ